MHVPETESSIDFQLVPEVRWIGRSFLAWLRPPASNEPAWLR
jgi:hypothetical protein